MPCSGGDIFWDKFKIFYKNEFFCKYSLHGNNFLHTLIGSHKLHKDTNFFQYSIIISEWRFAVKCIFYNGNFICPKKWTYLFVAKELMGRLGSNFHRKLLAISCISSYQTFCFKYIINENI